jgi:hypothetical protein
MASNACDRRMRKSNVELFDSFFVCSRLFVPWLKHTHPLWQGSSFISADFHSCHVACCTYDGDLERGFVNVERLQLPKLGMINGTDTVQNKKCATTHGKGLHGRISSCKIYRQHCVQPQQCIKWGLVSFIQEPGNNVRPASSVCQKKICMSLAACFVQRNRISSMWSPKPSM